MLLTETYIRRFLGSLFSVMLLIQLTACGADEIPCSQNDLNHPCHQEDDSVELVEATENESVLFLFSA